MIWQFHRTNLIFGLLALLGILQFALSVIYAISIYPDGYSITENFLSDLGRMRTWGGKENTICAAVFNRSLVGLGTSLIPFFAFMPAVFSTGRSVLGVSGVLSALGLIGIGVTPYDAYFVEHHASLALWIVAMLVMMVTLLLAAKADGVLTSALGFGTLLVLLAVCAYALAGSHNGYVVFQKVLVLIACFWFCLVFITVSVSTIQSMTSRRMIVERQALKYLEVFQRRRGRPYQPPRRRASSGSKARRRIDRRR